MIWYLIWLVEKTSANSYQSNFERYKLQHFSQVSYTFFFLETKDIRLISTYSSISKVLTKLELQKIEIIHFFDANFKEFINLQKHAPDIY